MTAAQIAERAAHKAHKDLYRRILRLSDDETERVTEFIDGLACPELYREHIPNEETEAALREAEGLDGLTTCADLRDMLEKCGIK